MVTVISGTNREDSKSLAIASLCARLFEESLQVELLDLREHEDKFLTSNLYEKFKSSLPFTDKYFIKANSFLIILPEYNGSFPGFLKFVIDALPPKLFRGKVIGLIGVASGRAGNQRGLDQLTGVFQHMKCDVYYHKMPISRIEEFVSEDGKVEEGLVSQLESFISNFTKYAQIKA